MRHQGNDCFANCKLCISFIDVFTIFLRTGELSQNPGDKKSERDFALWKASKPGEPAWDSPWGKVNDIPGEFLGKGKNHPWGKVNNIPGER